MLPQIDLETKPRPPSEWPSAQAFSTFLFLMLGVAALFLPFAGLTLMAAILVAGPTYLAGKFLQASARRRRQSMYCSAVAAPPSEHDERPLSAGEIALQATPEVDPFSPRNPRQMRRGACVAFVGFSGALACAALMGLFPMMDASLLDVLRRVCLIVFILGLLLVVEGNIRWELRRKRISERLATVVLPRDPTERKWVHGYLLLFPLLGGFLIWSFVLVTMTFGYVAIAGATLYYLVRSPRSLRAFFLAAFVASLLWPVANCVLLSIELPPLTYGHGRGMLTTAGWCLVLFEWSAVILIPGAGFFGRWIMDAILGDRGGLPTERLPPSG